MSSDIRLAASGLGKRFDLFRHPAGRLVQQFVPLAPAQRHWAVRAVDLVAETSDCIGIIGRNGSGKSTLLAMLAGTMTPSEGTLERRGRVAALLELGAGFHPDFTGRENVFLSAAVYGLSGRQTEDRLAAMEAFAGIGDFIDRPVRQYSSGMYARLAFAVAAHVDADILIVDEILGVGDVRFQQRCARFITDFRKRGIVLLVSHSEQTVLALCNKAIWLANGKVAAVGGPREVSHAYHAATQRQFAASVEGFEASGRLAVAAGLIEPHRPAASGPKGGHRFNFDDLPLEAAGARLQSCRLLCGGEGLSTARGGEEVTLRISVAFAVACERPAIGFVLRDRVGVAICGADTSEFAGSVNSLAVGEGVEVEFDFLLPFLASGAYTVEIAALDLSKGSPAALLRAIDAVVLQVVSPHVSSGMTGVPLEGATILANGDALAP